MRSHRFVFCLLVVLAALGAWARVAHAVVTVSTAGISWDFNDTSGGSITDARTIDSSMTDAYDGAFLLDVGGMRYPASPSTTSCGGRQYDLGEVTLGSFAVARHVYFPADHDYVRYVDVVRNTGSAATIATITVSGNMGSDSSTVLQTTSSGDASLTTDDDWWASDDVDGSSDPSNAVVVQGSGGEIRASTMSLTSDNFTWTFSVMLAPSESAAVMTIGVLGGTQMVVQAEARRLLDLPDDVLVCTEDVIDSIKNFSVGTPGAPHIRSLGPYTMAEGGSVDVAIEVTDHEGDSFSLAWDLDGDGTYGDLPGAMMAHIDGSTSDGPGTMRVGVRAEDSHGNAAERAVIVTVTNVPPTITSPPPPDTTGLGATYMHRFVISDPAGDRDPPHFDLAGAPDRMIVDDSGTVRWMPTETDVTTGEPYQITVHVADGDGGETSQSWTLQVLPNRVPTTPTILFPSDGEALGYTNPRLVALDSFDGDFETLTYYFEIDRADTFDSPSLRQSGALPEQPAFTAWEPEGPLAEGTWSWRVWATDGMSESPRAAAQFQIVLPHDADASIPDGGTAGDGGAADAAVHPPRKGGGCTVASGRKDASALLPWVLALSTLVAVGRRRTRR